MCLMLSILNRIRNIHSLILIWVFFHKALPECFVEIRFLSDFNMILLLHKNHKFQNITSLKHLVKYYLVHKDCTRYLRDLHTKAETEGDCNRCIIKKSHIQSKISLILLISVLCNPQGKTSYNHGLQEEFTVNIYVH